MTDGKQWLVCYEESGRTQTASGYATKQAAIYGARELERERGKIILSIERGDVKIPWEQARTAATRG